LRVAGYQRLADAAELKKEVAARNTAGQRVSVIEAELTELQEQSQEEVAGRKAAEKRLTVVDAELAELQDDYEQAIAICDTAEDRLVASEHGNAVLFAPSKTTRRLSMNRTRNWQRCKRTTMSFSKYYEVSAISGILPTNASTSSRTRT
jgi:chromosome segregation ATPase